MTRWCAIWLSLLMPTAVFGQDSVFEYGYWPGEGIPVLAAKNPELRVHTRPDVRLISRRISYGRGWRIPIADNLVRTLKGVQLKTVAAGTIEVYCDAGQPERLTLSAGESWTYFQYRAEGFVWARIQGKNCQVPVHTKEAIFGHDLPQPEVQWWVQVKYADDSSPGWLLVTEDQVQVGQRKF